MGDDAPASEQPDSDAVDFSRIQRSPEFALLRRSHRRFVLPVVAVCLSWYVSYLLLANYAPAVMATPVIGLVNVGLLLGLAQIATTFLVTTWYVWFANRQLDPAAERLRAQVATGSTTQPGSTAVDSGGRQPGEEPS
jgi:uncharacterized membrane protein (DUF485 family)